MVQVEEMCLRAKAGKGAEIRRAPVRKRKKGKPNWKGIEGFQKKSHNHQEEGGICAGSK